MKSISAIFTLMGILLLTLPTRAQEYNDEELQKFAKVILEVIPLEHESRMQMIVIVEESELTSLRFKEMLLENQGKSIGEVKGTKQEKEVFADVSLKILEIQEKLENRLVKFIEDGGLTVEKYEQILADYKQDPQLQEKIQEIIFQLP